MFVMNLGTFVVSAILLGIVCAIIVHWVKTKRAGRSIGCEGCGGCSCSSSSCGCAESMLERVDADLTKRS